jgi:predicted O-methyltransferase YrrM
VWHLLDTHRPKNLLDLGSGVSSAIFATFTARYGGQCTSVDHLPEFAAATQRLVQSWGVGQNWSMLQADVVLQKTRNRTATFYDLAPVRSLRRRHDFVFLDGPPKSISPSVRGDFLPLFAPVLENNCLIVMDDYYREAEQDAVRRWVEKGFAEVVEINSSVEKHAAVLRFIRPQREPRQPDPAP